MRIAALAIQIALLALLGLPAAAQSGLQSLVDPEAWEQLAAGKPLVRPFSGEAALTLMPRVSTCDALAAEVRAARPTVGTEVLLVIRAMPEEMDTGEGWLRLYNALHAVSTMKGITYWSASRKEQRVLFTESFAIPSPRTVSRIPDPVFAALPAEDTMQTLQEDQSYGRNTYAQRFSYSGDHVLVRIQNTSAVSIAFIPVMQPGGFVSCSIIVPVGKDLLFYGVSYIRTSFPLGDRHKRQESLANRLIAMADWLRSRLS